MKHRAQALGAEDRRRSIFAAVVPLLARKGSKVTTAEMARAAGIAEGTIFKVFPDKAALICGAVKAVIDPGATCDAVKAIPQSDPIERQLAAAADILLERLERVTALGEVLRSLPDAGERRLADTRRYVVASNAAISAELTALLERHRARLRVEPSRAAAALRGLIFASGHPLLPAADRLSVGDIVSTLMHGISREKD